MENLTEFLSSPLGMILAAAVAFLVGSMVFNVKQFEAHWKQSAIDTANAMSKAGLVHTPKILNALAVGDLAGSFQEIKNLSAIFTDPAQLKAEFQTVFTNMLNAAFADPTQAKNLQQLANDAVAAFASGNPAASAVQLAADAQAVAAGNPMFSQIAQSGVQFPTLQNPFSAVAGQIASALQNLQPTAPPASSPAPAALPTVPAGHTVTIAGPAVAPSSSAPTTPAPVAA